jgi:ketosteroid isomerase-like protein
MTPKAIEDWLAIAESKDDGRLDRLLADDVVFRSPVVHAPQKGKAITAKYLKSAVSLLGNSSFRYVETWLSERSAVLEFETSTASISSIGTTTIKSYLSKLWFGLLKR